MSIRIKHAWPDTLCATCKSSTMIETEAGGFRAYCHVLSREIRFRVKECNSYRLQHTDSLYEMKEIGWILDSSPRQIGFMRPGTASHREAKRDLDDMEDL